MAYNREDNVQLLTDILSKEFKIYVHWDFKNPIPESLKSNEKLTLIKNRTACCWGDLSIGTAAYVSMQQIFKDDIDTVTVISGNDFPCMNLKKMKSVLDSLETSLVQSDPSPNKFLRADTIGPAASSMRTHDSEDVRMIFGGKTQRYGLPFPLHESVGPNWCTIRKCEFDVIRESVVRYPNLIKALSLTLNGDEYLFQSLFKVSNLPFNNCRRFTIWSNDAPHPDTLTENQIAVLLRKSDNINFFARKIDPSSIPSDSEVYKLL